MAINTHEVPNRLNAPWASFARRESVGRILCELATSLPGWRGGCYHVVPVLVGLVLLVAGGLKIHQMATEPLIETGLGSARWFVALVVEFELLLGVWLISQFLPRHASVCATGCFAVFACVSLLKVVAGAPSCGCLGALRVNPWYTFGFDAVAVGALLATRLRGGGIAVVDEVHGRRRAGWVMLATWLMLAAPAAWVMLRMPDGRATALGTVLAGGRIVVLEPEKWIGKRLPLLEYIDIRRDLSQGRWVVLFYRRDCAKCEQAIPQYLRRSREDSRAPVAFVEMPPHSETDTLVRANPPTILAGRLSASRDWLTETPLEVVIHNGVVTRIAANILALERSCK